jgi:L-cysteine:1D-myo-inositol 2-amino-2-deoxy-alpha-D-glucopyranoside ligase
MATEYLGDVIDIHGGGADLIFPHHECEIAQAEGATGRSPFSRFWLHTGMVRYEGEKMSKSLGNLIMVRDLLEAGWAPDALRLYMAQHHYREPWTFQEATLQQAAGTVERLSDAVGASAAAAGGDDERLDPQGAVNDFTTAMDDDLDTAAAITALTQLGDEIREAAAAGRDVRSAQTALRQMASVLGLTLDRDRPETRVSSGWDRHRERFS